MSVGHAVPGTPGFTYSRVNTPGTPVMAMRVSSASSSRWIMASASGERVTAKR